MQFNNMETLIVGSKLNSQFSSNGKLELILLPILKIHKHFDNEMLLKMHGTTNIF
jgi:hypothetical protein